MFITLDNKREDSLLDRKEGQKFKNACSHVASSKFDLELRFILAESGWNVTAQGDAGRGSEGETGELSG